MGIFSGGYSGGLQGFFEEVHSYVTTGDSVGMASQEDICKHQKCLQTVEKVVECTLCPRPRPESCIVCLVCKTTN